ncbi:DUF6498-containing protein [Haloterrigena salifodinae]|uniref:DUF6498-containing protein n=1 Tax=Haloterrigena salifodinae TaxID=2675099 RepID=UPI0037441EC5
MSSSQPAIRTTFPLILVVNLLPVAGVVFLEWRVYEATFAYWVAIGFCILL